MNTLFLYFKLPAVGSDSLLDRSIGVERLFMRTEDQSGKFLTMVSTVMNMLLLFLNIVMILFKVHSNRERNEKKYALLWKLGINDAEIDKTRKTETAIVFIIPSFVAVCIGAIMTMGLIKNTI